MCADDTDLTYADKDVSEYHSVLGLNEDLLKIRKWLIANKLPLNMTKTEFMLIGSRQKLNTLIASPVLNINGTGTTVNQVSTSKSLGVLIDANVTCGSHIESYHISWLKNLLWFCRYQTGQAIYAPSNIASYLQSLDSGAFRLLQCCLGKLWHKTSRQISKDPKWCSASSSFLKL